jgi:predicted phage terminase large subunit-like protein
VASRTTKSSRSSKRPASSRSSAERQARLLALELDRRACEADLLTFLRGAWPVLEPAVPFEQNWHHELLAEYLMACTRGQLTRLIINVPPRFTKSRLASVMWPCWVWTQRPSSAWIFGSYAAGLSVDHSRDRRLVLSSDWYRTRWGDQVEFAPDQNLKTVYENLKRGSMYATSVGGTVMGLGGDCIVIDDPHNPQQVLSEVERATALRWVDQQLVTRLNDARTGVIVVIMQRLHERDLTGHLLEHGGWKQVSLPAEADGPEEVVFPLSHRVHERVTGELLWDRPPRHAGEPTSRQALDALKVSMGSWAASGQLQQRPTPLGGGIFKRAWFTKFWTPQTLPPFQEIVQSWDCAFKDLKDSDYVVGQLWGRAGGDFYLLDQVRDHMSFTATCAVIEHPTGAWQRATAKLVEDKANGPAVIDTLKHRVSGLIAVEPEGGKIARAQAVSPLAEAGNVVLPADAPWVEAFLHEITAFPTGAHDDQVDAMTQALHRMKTGAASAAAWTEFVKGEVLGDAKEASHVARGTVRTRG